MNDDRAANLESARRDIEAIRSLQKNDHFLGYWMRRLRQKRDEKHNSFLNDGPDKCDKDRREGLRLAVLAYDELIAMMENDEQAHQRTLTQSVTRHSS